jgi:hypothetical protein
MLRHSFTLSKMLYFGFIRKLLYSWQVPFEPLGRRPIRLVCVSAFNFSVINERLEYFFVACLYYDYCGIHL